LPQKADNHSFLETGCGVKCKGNWFVSNAFIAWRVSIFFKWVLKLKFFFKQIRYRFSKIQIGPMHLRVKFLKTKNARMGKGRGGAKTFLISFIPHSRLFRFKNRSPLFFYRFYSFIRKTQASFIVYFLGNAA
jgi:hypothetical protein